MIENLTQLFGAGALFFQAVGIVLLLVVAMFFLLPMDKLLKSKPGCLLRKVLKPLKWWKRPKGEK